MSFQILGRLINQHNYTLCLFTTELFYLKDYMCFLYNCGRVFTISRFNAIKNINPDYEILLFISQNIIIYSNYIFYSPSTSFNKLFYMQVRTFFNLILHIRKRKILNSYIFIAYMQTKLTILHSL